jgi:serine/threonine-protein kinase
VRVTAQLINSTDGYHLWSTRLDRDAEDLLAIQDEIATAIAGKLEATLGGKAAPESLARPTTQNPEAYDLYLKGRFHLEQRGDGLRQGLEFFQKAIELDPGFAAAHAGAAEGYVVRGFYGFVPPREAMPKAKAAARKALALDENLAAAHSALALVTMIYDWDWKASESGFKRAIKLDPKNTYARCWYGLYSLLCIRGLVDEAVAECEKVIEIDPVDTFPLAILGTALYTARRYEEALPYLLEVVGRSPGSYAGWRLLGLVHLARSSHAEARTALERAAELSGRNPWPVAELGIIHAASGRPADAQALYDELGVRAEETWTSPVCRALLSMALGRLDEAFSHLDRAYRERDSLLIGFRQWPLLDPLRADPRFDQLLKRIGFEPVRGGEAQPEAAPQAADSAVARKMVVVLPFENLGPSEEDYFADGMTEEITSRLAEISNLGVISRTSAVQYDRSGKTIRELGQDLGAGYVLEGTVRWDQRAGNRVRITPQLIRVSDDTHLWTERYDRVIDDIFAVQSEIAKNVISHLEASLLETGSRALATKPTENLEAYQAYLRGLSHTSEESITEDDIQLAIKMFERAVELDPAFAQAYARMALDHSSMHVFGYDMTPSRIAMAKEAADRAQELAPGTYHAHMAQGYYFYRCEKNYERALQEFEKAAEQRPNDATLWASMSYIQRRRGHWEESIGKLEKSLELDPQNAVRLGQLGISLCWTRKYERAEQMFERSIFLLPDQEDSYLERVFNLWMWNGLLGRAAEVLEGIPAQKHPRVVLAWYFQDFFSGNWESALKRITAMTTDLFIEQEGYYPKPLLLYWCLARMGEKSKALKCARAALAILEKAVKENPTDPRVHCSLGRLYADLGRHTDAIREGRLAMKISPVEKDVLLGTTVLIEMAKIRVHAGEVEVALDQIEHLLSVPAELSPALLRMDPVWNPLRGNRRFEKLVG